MIKEIREYGFKYLVRPPERGPFPADFSEEVARKVELFHRQIPGYRPTNLVRWSKLAEAWGVKEIFIKDESTRFNLKAFKVLGGSYAVARVMWRKLGRSPEHIDFAHLIGDEARKLIGQITLTTATDGNHGRGVAWAAEQLHQKAVIYMPKGAALSRVENIRSREPRNRLARKISVALLIRFAPSYPWRPVRRSHDFFRIYTWSFTLKTRTSSACLSYLERTGDQALELHRRGLSCRQMPAKAFRPGTADRLRDPGAFHRQAPRPVLHRRSPLNRIQMANNGFSIDTMKRLF